MTLIVLAVVISVLTGLLVWQIFQEPPSCGRTHYEYFGERPSVFQDSIYALMLNEEKAERQKFEALAEERLRMLHRLNDIYTNRSCND